MSRPAQVALAAGVLLHVLLCLSSMAGKSYTHDERNHYRYGVRAARGDLAEPSLQRMPVTAINVVPAWIRDRLGGPTWDFAHVDPTSVWLSRLPTVAVSALLACAVFFFARREYGAPAGWFAWTLYSLSPNILAHARLLTTDLYVTAAIFAAVWSFRELARQPSPRRLLVSALTLGAAQLCKQTAVLLIPMFALLWLGRTLAARRRPTWREFGAAAAYLLVVAFVLNAGYLFTGSFRTIDAFDLAGTPLAGIVALWPSWIPVPLPQAYLKMTALGFEINASGAHHGLIYLCGRLSADGFRAYFPVAFALKTPLALLALLGWALGEGLLRRRPLSGADPYLLLPALGIFGFFTLFAHAQLGARYLLPVLPLLHVLLAGRLTRVPGGRARRVALVGLLLWYGVSSLSFHPHYLSYFNETIGDRKNMYRYLADSNVDWGQNGPALERYLQAHAGETIAVEPDAPVTGKVIVSVNSLVGVGAPRERYAWLRDHHEPIDHVAYSWLVFEVPATP